jgi:hypothetical protein
MTSGGTTCLRCDWNGDARTNSPCPRCGAPLFSAKPAATRAPAVSARGSKAQADTVGEAGGGTVPRAGRRAVGPAVFAAISLLVALALVLSQRHPHSRPGSAGTSGVLIYSVSLPAGTSQLYRWDLATGKVTPGPKILGLDSLSPTAKPGWVGVSRYLPSGQMQAGVLKTLTAGEALKPLLVGRFVAFDASGTSAVSIREGPQTLGCNNRMAVDVREIAVGVGQRQYQSRTCSFVLSIARAGGTTYLSLVRGRSLSIEFVGYGVLHQILGGNKLESISSANDMLVVPNQGQSAGLFFRGTGALDPIPIASDGQPLELAFVLAWSPDASKALVVGQVGGQVGIYEVEVGPGVSPRVPAFVTSIPDRAWASYAADGTAYVASGGRMFTLRDGQVSALPLPSGAPAPDGPVMWLPA